MSEPLDIVEICWSGPHSPEEVFTTMNGPADYGLYACYGTHSIFGPDALLYIGKADQQRFFERVRQSVEGWMSGEASAVDVYLGRLGGTSTMTKDEESAWDERIRRVERLLIYSCQPPYNGTGLSKPPQLRPTLVLNHGRRHRLTHAATSLSWDSQFGTPDWHAFSMPD